MNKRRHNMTQVCYPNPVSLEEFLDEMRDSLEGFEENSVSLRQDTGVLGKFWNQEHLMEEWFEVFARWSEIQSEGFDPFLPEE